MTIDVVYHREGPTWWADSPDAPGFFAVADTLAELRADVHGALSFHFDDRRSFDIRERTADGEPLPVACA